MSALKKKLLYPTNETKSLRADPQESLRKIKIEAEALREQLQKRVMEHPKTAQKAALLISIWINGKKKA